MGSHDEWQTPPELFAVLKSEFNFDLDIAASSQNHMVYWWVGPDNHDPYRRDALTIPWDGARIWCNPPYTKLPAFVARAWEQCQEQHNTAVMLIPAYTDPKYWWNIIVPHADEARFLKGRLQFLENGTKKQSAHFPSVVVVFRWRSGEWHKKVHTWWWDWRAKVSD